MSKAEDEYRKIAEALADGARVVASQMFGKPCLKVGGKAFLAQHKDAVVFKLGSPDHERALAMEGSVLWDPSGKGRPMREWVAVPVTATTAKGLRVLANGALRHVSAAA